MRGVEGRGRALIAPRASRWVTLPPTLYVMSAVPLELTASLRCEALRAISCDAPAGATRASAPPSAQTKTLKRIGTETALWRVTGRTTTFDSSDDRRPP